MPVATLTFNLPEEEKDFHCTVNGTMFAILIHEFDTILRNKIKHSSPEDDHLIDGLQTARDELRKLINDYELYNLIFEE